MSPSSELHQNYLDTFYRCLTEKGKICRDMVAEHMLVFIMSGQMTLIAGDRREKIKNGEAVFVRRNHLVHEVKEPDVSGRPFKGLFLHLSAAALRKMLPMLALPEVGPADAMADCLQVALPAHLFLQGLFQSLDIYFTEDVSLAEELVEAKLYETVLILLQIKPELAGILFDFRSPWKPDLRDFMEKNYLSELNVEQFAHYTGRSLSAFKRYFSKTFSDTPAHWIMSHRLDRAHELLTAGGQSPSEVYLRVGFKNLSHFTSAFKRQFGVTPSAVQHSELQTVGV